MGGANSVVVSHLQFVNDTLLIGNKRWVINVRAMRVGLVLFDMSGLKVNFNKKLSSWGQYQCFLVV